MSLVLATLLLLAVSAVPALAARGGVPGSPIASGAIYADGSLYATIGQGALPYNGRDASYDHLYLVDGQPPVSEAAPGNAAYNGGRWLPTPTTWLVAPGDRPTLRSLADVLQAVDEGLLEIGDPDTEATFLCPLIPNH